MARPIELQQPVLLVVKPGLYLGANVLGIKPLLAVVK
jgi:hypothetical protein